MKHQRSLSELLMIICVVVMLFVCLSQIGCRTRKVDTQKSSTEVKVDSTSKKSETKSQEEITKTDSLGSQKTLHKSEKEYFSSPDSVKVDHKTRITTFYLNGKDFRLSDVSLYQNEQESLKTSLNSLNLNQSKNEEKKASINSAGTEVAKNTKTSGQSFGGIIAIALTCLVIGGVWSWRTK